MDTKDKVRELIIDTFGPFGPLRDNSQIDGCYYDEIVKERPPYDFLYRIGETIPFDLLYAIFTGLTFHKFEEGKTVTKWQRKRFAKKMSEVLKSELSIKLSSEKILSRNTVREMLDLVEKSVATKPTEVVGLDSFPIHDRKLVFLGDSGTDPRVKTIKYVDYNSLPKGFEFRGAERNKLFVLHPLSSNVYIPFEDSDVFLLLEKTRELISFFVALGAKRIVARAEVRHSSSTNASSDSSMSGSLGYKAFSASGSYNRSSSIYEEEAKSSQFNFEREFQGRQNLSALNDLQWYRHESSWQQIKRDFENGGLKRLRESISISSTRTVNNSNREAVKADLKLLFANVSGTYEKTIKSMIETQDDLIETIEVEF